jgi:hypothetical protein
MLTALVQLRRAEIDPGVPSDEIEDIDIEETGFQATFTKLAVAALPTVEMVPFSTVDDTVKNFVVKFAAADSTMGGALVGRVRNEVPPQMKAILADWGLAV